MFSKFLPAALALTTMICTTQLSANEHKHDFIDSYSASIYHQLVELRRDFHDHPEPSGEEQRTSSVVAQYLTDLGLEVKTNIGGYGVVGILKGAKEGKRIAWRADMDAATFSYADNDHESSIENKLGHVCGHDVHTTIGLGIANTLSQNIDDLSGTIYFLFQPAEETQRGAKAMIKDGLFELINPDEIYGLHVGPMKTGTVTTLPGNVFSHARRIKLTFGKADNHEELTATVNSIMESLVRVASTSKFKNLTNITSPSLGLESPNTIYQDYVTFYEKPYFNKLADSLVFQTEVYTSERAELDNIVESIKQMIAKTKYNNRLRSVEYFDEREGVNNDPTLVKEAIKTLRDVYGNGAVTDVYGKFPFASEDFGHFQRTIPGVYFFLGAANPSLGITAFPHMPNFSVDETSINVGVSYFSTLILARLGLVKPSLTRTKSR